MKLLTKKDPVNRKRSKLFRALGKQDPPTPIVINDQHFQHSTTVKHDSWAATAIYSNGSRKVVCKFNRMEPIFFIPMKWLGRKLAKRENDMYALLSDLPEIAEGYSKVYVDGELATNAAAHAFIDGHPVRWHDNLNDTFFDNLLGTINELHRRDIAYVDLNKSENVIMNQNGDPCLIDFQISFRLPRRFPSNIWPLSAAARVALKILQHCDLYHLAKLKNRYRPDQMPESERAEMFRRPWPIRLHRKFAVPFRTLRRRILVLAKIRSGTGKPQSERFIEEGLRTTSGEPKPILRLYSLLLSNDYLSRYGSTTESYLQQIYVDLCGHEPTDPEDSKLLNPKREVSQHDVVNLLRSKTVFSISKQWDDDWVEQKIQSITERLLQEHSSPSRDVTSQKAA